MSKKLRKVIIYKVQPINKPDKLFVGVTIRCEKEINATYRQYYKRYINNTIGDLKMNSKIIDIFKYGEFTIDILDVVYDDDYFNNRMTIEYENQIKYMSI